MEGILDFWRSQVIPIRENQVSIPNQLITWWCLERRHLHWGFIIVFAPCKHMLVDLTFGTFLPFKKEYKRHLPKNQRIQLFTPILAVIGLEERKWNENANCIFEKHCTIVPKVFQTDGPMVHLIHHKLKSLVRGTMERFLKKEAMIGASGKFSTKCWSYEAGKSSHVR